MSRQFIQQQNIIPGQLTQFRDEFFRAEKKIPRVPCFMQCDCHMPQFSDAVGCSGYCYRWANGGVIVFKRVKESDIPEDVQLVETKFARDSREHGEVGLKEQHHG